MTLVVPNAIEIQALTALLTPGHTLRLYGNNYTPVETSVVGDFTEIVGGGYAAKALTFANWGITGGDPTIAIYNASQNWTYTGPVNAPGTVYGYFITKDSDGTLIYAERFPAGSLPFSPVAGSVTRVLPRITCE